MSQGNVITCMVQGRIVYTVGDLFKGDVAKNFGTQNPKLNKQGQQFREYGFGLAVPKGALGQPGGIWEKIHEAAYTLFPNRVIPADFHMKYKDGDTGTNKDGTPVNVKKGYPGNVVFSLKTTIAIKFYKFENGQNFLINEGIKCGDYVNVQLSINVNPGTNRGLYLNPNAVQFLGFGEEIVNAPSADQIFGVQAPPLPPGASATPFAPAGFITPPGIPAPQAAPQGFAPPPVAAPGYPPQAAPVPVQPNWGVLPQAHQPQGYPQPAGYPPQAAPAYPSSPGAMPPLPK